MLYSEAPIRELISGSDYWTASISRRTSTKVNQRNKLKACMP